MTRSFFEIMLIKLIKIVTFLLVFVSSSVFAECSEAEIKNLASQGKSVSRISALCDVPKQDVRDILESDKEPEIPEPPRRNTSPSNRNQSLMPPGTAISPCGCNGYVYPGTQFQSPVCQSGYAMAVMCQGFCPGGGYQWQGVCGR